MQEKKRNRLFIGDGNFSYAVNLIQKRPNLAPKIIGSEYQSEQQLIDRLGDEFLKNKAYLEEKSVLLFFKLDATQLSKDHRVSEYHFKHIHFNFPHSGDLYTANLVEASFLQFQKMQGIGDRVYMALVDDKKKLPHWHGRVYNIVNASAEAGYIFYKKKKLKERFPNYQHVQTKKSKGSDNFVFGKEYIFKKSDKSREEIFEYNNEQIKRKNYSHLGKPHALTYYECPTSEGTNTYESDSFLSFSQGKTDVINTQESFDLGSFPFIFYSLPSQKEKNSMKQSREQFEYLRELIKQKDIEKFNHSLDAATQSGFDINFVYHDKIKPKHLPDNPMNDSLSHVDQSVVQENKNLIHTAIEFGCHEVLKALYDKNADFNIPMERKIRFRRAFLSKFTGLEDRRERDYDHKKESLTIFDFSSHDTEIFLRNLITQKRENTRGISNSSVSNDGIPEPSDARESQLELAYRKKEKYKFKYLETKGRIKAGEVTISDENVNTLLENCYRYLGDSMDSGKRKYDEIRGDEKENLVRKTRRIGSLGVEPEPEGFDFAGVIRKGEVLQEIGNIGRQGFFSLANKIADEYLNEDKVAERDIYNFNFSQTSSDD